MFSHQLAPLTCTLAPRTRTAMPMDTMSTQMQLQGYRSPLECTRAILQAKGVLGLYAGFVPFLMQSAAKSSVRFYSFELLANGVDACVFFRLALP